MRALPARRGRQAVRRGGKVARPRRRPLLWAVAVLLLVTAGGAGVWSLRGGVSLTLPSMDLAGAGRFPFRQVKVAGPFHHVSAARVRNIVAPLAAKGFFATDVGAIHDALQALPWVERAAVRRVWPDQLQVTLTEQVAVARWGERDLLNPRGELFRPAPDTLPVGLPRLQGPGGSAPQVLARWRVMEAYFAPLGRKVAVLTLDRRRSWQARLDNGIRLALGKDRPVQRLSRFLRYYPRLAAGREADIEAVDLRYANGFAMRWRKGATAGNA